MMLEVQVGSQDSTPQLRLPFAFEGGYAENLCAQAFPEMKRGDALHLAIARAWYHAKEKNRKPIPGANKQLDS